MVEEHVHELPQQVVERLDELLPHERVVAGRRELPLGADARAEADRQAAPLRRARQRGARLGLAVLGAEGDHDVARLGEQLDLEIERPALRRQADRRQRALPDDHGMDELDGHVPDVRARRG